MEQVIQNQQDIDVPVTPGQRAQLSRLGQILRGFVITDVALVLYLTFGLIFPSKITPRDPDVAMPDSYYNLSAKQSPLEIPNHASKAPRNKPPLVSARSLPLPYVPAVEGAVEQVLPVGYVVGQKPPVRVSPADAEADLTTARKRTT